MPVVIGKHVARWESSPFAAVTDSPWRATQTAEALIAAALETLSADYRLVGDIATHGKAIVEAGAVIKGPAIIGSGCFVAATAYLRGGVFMDEDCIVGPGAELKTSFMFKGAKLAHFNFVGDSILGEGVNLEAGSIVANYRNELADKTIRILQGDAVIETGVDKFGALLGDGTRVGANAVIAPGAILPRHSRVGRLSLIDQHPWSRTGADAPARS
jgi:NDP-sugar pyrophosphorylase family protein